MVNVKSTRACMASYRGCFAVLVHSRTRIGLVLEAVCVCVCVCVCAYMCVWYYLFLLLTCIIGYPVEL